MTLTALTPRWRQLLLISCLLLLLPAPARAQVVTNVDCTTQSLQGALNGLNKAASNIVNVSGSCSGNFFITGFNDLTLAGNPSATLSAAPVACNAGSAGVLFVINSNQVVLSNLSISGGRGLFVIDSKVSPPNSGPSNLKVSGSNAYGVIVSGSRANLTLTSSDEVSGSCLSGVFIVGGGQLTTAANIHDNGNWGIEAFQGSNVWIGGGNVHDNGVGGAIVSGLSHLLFAGGTVQHNGANPFGLDATYRAGVAGLWGAGVQVVGGTIQNNTGPGILLRLNATGAFGVMTVQSNSEGGVNLVYASVADFTSFAGAAVMHDNGDGKAIGDLNCDSSSQAFGDVSQVANNQCKGKTK